MQLKNIIHEDLTNYKTCSMFLGFPSCNWKCERDCGKRGLCQNATLALTPSVEITVEEVVATYLANPFSSAIVCGGLEPMDSIEDLLELIAELRKHTLDDCVIYTGYKKEELVEVLPKFKQFRNIIIKFGRFIPDSTPRYDKILGVKLASNNQYAERIS